MCKGAVDKFLLVDEEDVLQILPKQIYYWCCRCEKANSGRAALETRDSETKEGEWEAVHEY